MISGMNRAQMERFARKLGGISDELHSQGRHGFHDVPTKTAMTAAHYTLAAIVEAFEFAMKEPPKPGRGA